MDLQALKELFSELDPETLAEKLMPKLDTVLGWVVLATRVAVMIAPLLLLGFGLLYLLTPPKEANYSAGYRFWWGMSSLDAWRFTQKVAGILWTVLGLVLTIIMSLQCAKFVDMPPMDMLWAAGKCLLWQLGLAVGSGLVINAIVFVMFDRRGYRRREPIE